MDISEKAFDQSQIQIYNRCSNRGISVWYLKNEHLITLQTHIKKTIDVLNLKTQRTQFQFKYVFEINPEKHEHWTGK